MSQPSFCGVPLSVWGPSPTSRTLMNIRSYMVGDSLLDIGPGGGHFLTAAKDNLVPLKWNRVETRASGYILTCWGIEVFGDPIEQNKNQPKASTILSASTASNTSRTHQSRCGDLADSTAGWMRADR